MLVFARQTMPIPCLRSTVTLNGWTAPKGVFITVTQTVTLPFVSVVVYVVELNPTTSSIKVKEIYGYD